KVQSATFRHLQHSKAVQEVQRTTIVDQRRYSFASWPSYFPGSLHEYQLEGLNWLRYSWHQKRNVILADEMGLGKTVQSVTFLYSLLHEDLRGPFLIVVPLSTLRHWQRELFHWCPNLNTVVYTGNQDSRSVIHQ